MKSVPLTVRRCPQELHQSLKDSAKANRRSLNAEVLNRLEEQAEKPVLSSELAKRLRKARELMNEQEHREFAEDIEQGIQLMRREYLH